MPATKSARGRRQEPKSMAAKVGTGSSALGDQVKWCCFARDAMTELQLVCACLGYDSAQELPSRQRRILIGASMLSRLRSTLQHPFSIMCISTVMQGAAAGDKVRLAARGKPKDGAAGKPTKVECMHSMHDPQHCMCPTAHCVLLLGPRCPRPSRRRLPWPPCS